MSQTRYDVTIEVTIAKTYEVEASNPCKAQTLAQEQHSQYLDSLENDTGLAAQELYDYRDQWSVERWEDVEPTRVTINGTEFKRDHQGFYIEQSNTENGIEEPGDPMMFGSWSDMKYAIRLQRREAWLGYDKE